MIDKMKKQNENIAILEKKVKELNLQCENYKEMLKNDLGLVTSQVRGKIKEDLQKPGNATKQMVKANTDIVDDQRK